VRPAVFLAMIKHIALRQFRAVLELWAFHVKTEGIITDDSFKAHLSTERTNYLAVLKRLQQWLAGSFNSSSAARNSNLRG